MFSSKTVVVLGSAYGGARAAQILAAGIPEGWRVLLIDRNSHTNHVYIFPRLAVLAGHEHKAFIPNTNVFMTEKPPILHRRLQATVTSFSANSLTLNSSFPEHGIPTEKLDFDYAIYALGSHLPAPLNLWGTDSTGNPVPPKPSKGKQLPMYRGFKAEGIEWMKVHQKIIEDAPSVLVVGGGALGIQFTTDIAAVHPTKKVTLLHSRSRLLPRYDEGMHNEILQTMESFSNIDVILGERLDLSSVDEEPEKTNEHGQRIVRTVTGREIAADLLLLCTGQSPNTGLLKKMDVATVNPNNSLAHVIRTLQLGILPSPKAPDASDLEVALEKASLADDQSELQDGTEEPLEETPYPNIFVIGDAADAFGAIAAGHTAYNQGALAARNVIRLIKRSEGIEDEPLEHYQPGLPAIKVTIGRHKSVYQSQGVIGTANDNPDDLRAASIWPYYGITVTNDDQMYE